MWQKALPGSTCSVCDEPAAISYMSRVDRPLDDTKTMVENINGRLAIRPAPEWRSEPYTADEPRCRAHAPAAYKEAGQCHHPKAQRPTCERRRLR